MRRLLSALLLCTLSPALWGSAMVQQCESARESSVTYLRCLDRKLAQLDRALVLWGNNIIINLEEKIKTTGRTDSLRIFKKSQKSFAKYAEQHCRWQYVVLLPDGTAGARKYKECLVMMTEVRVNELKVVAKN